MYTPRHALRNLGKKDFAHFQHLFNQHKRPVQLQKMLIFHGKSNLGTATEIEVFLMSTLLFVFPHCPSVFLSLVFGHPEDLLCTVRCVLIENLTATDFTRKRIFTLKALQHFYHLAH